MTLPAATESARPAVSTTPLLEVCVDRFGDALAAVEAGANRLELCGTLELGGLTPSAGLVKQVLRETDEDVVAMVRPRAGGFCFDRHDFDVACREAEEILAAGVAGVVFGFLRADGTIDVETTGQFLELVGDVQTVFHRGFDFAPDAAGALEQLIELGVTRVLTSGGMPTALAGAARLRDLTRLAGERIEVMPGGGICPANVAEVVRAIECRQVHIGAAMAGQDSSLDRLPAIEFRESSPYTEGEYRALDFDLVNQTATALHQLHDVATPAAPHANGD